MKNKVEPHIPTSGVCFESGKLPTYRYSREEFEGQIISEMKEILVTVVEMSCGRRILVGMRF